MSVRGFFLVAADHAEHGLATTHRARVPARQVLHQALRLAMLGYDGNVMRLRRGEGAQARAQLLWAAARLLVPTAPNPLPGETGEAFACRALARLQRHQVVPILHQAARVTVTPQLVALVGR